MGDESGYENDRHQLLCSDRNMSRCWIALDHRQINLWWTWAEISKKSSELEKQLEYIRKKEADNKHGYRWEKEVIITLNNASRMKSCFCSISCGFFCSFKSMIIPLPFHCPAFPQRLYQRKIPGLILKHLVVQFHHLVASQLNHCLYLADYTD